MPVYTYDDQNKLHEDTRRSVEDMPVEEAHSIKQEDDNDEGFIPRSPDPSTWPVKTNKFYISGKDKVYITVLLILTIVLLIITLSVFICVKAFSTSDKNDEIHTTAPEESTTTDSVMNVPASTYPFASNLADFKLLDFASDSKTIDASTIYSDHAVVVDMTNMKVTASLLADDKIYPASITKVMTLVVAVENLKTEDSLNETITVSKSVFDKMQAEGSSGAGMKPGEKLSVEAMIYALILKSDGIAATELAIYTAGSEENFVTMMNSKAKELELIGTHFTNPTGLHDDDHYSTCRDLATIMAYAMKNDMCRRVLTEDLYTAPCTSSDGSVFNYYFYHSLLVTQFDKTPVDHPAGMTVIAGKTGYTDEAKVCLATAAKDSQGREYIVVTTGADKVSGAYYDKCIKDYIKLYSVYSA